LNVHNKCMADLIFEGGSVITMEDPVGARLLDIAVTGGCIQELASHNGLNHLKGSKTKVIKVQGKTLMPGLIDSHNHMISFGQNLMNVDVRPTEVDCIGDVISRLKEEASKKPVGQWVKAWGYDDTRMKEGRYPTLEELDTACSDHPVSILRTCGHVMIVNSLALNLADISYNTPEPEGGEIVRDQHGAPTGELRELAAMNLVNRLIPYPSPDDCAQALALASEKYVSEGITMVTEAGAGWTGNPYEAAGFQCAWQSGQLKLRVTVGLMDTTYKLLADQGGMGIFTGFGNDYLKIGAVKFVADGGIGARTAALSVPYEDSGSSGVMCEDPKSLLERMEKFHNAGWQIFVHAIGDRTLDMVINAYEAILSRYPRPQRHRIEHAAVSNPSLIKRIAKLGLCVVVQPAFLYFLGDSFIQNLGVQRMKNTLAFRSMLDEGIKVVGSSDRPVTEGNPWIAIWAAVKRTTISGQEISPNEALTTIEALKLYTVNSAFVNFDEDRLGTLSPGKYADIILLGKNPLAIDQEELKDIKVLRTFIGGKEVYRSE
jgi:predicted amidohydrolase YtcJ